MSKVDQSELRIHEVPPLQLPKRQVILFQMTSVTTPY